MVQVQQRILLCKSLRTSKEHRALKAKSAGDLTGSKQAPNKTLYSCSLSPTIPLKFGHAVSVSANILLCCASMLSSHRVQ